MRLRATRLISAGRGRPAWTPAQIPTALWLDAADSSTITLNGSTVSQWSDKSGNGNNAVQATSASQPSYSTSALSNNRPAIVFDGINDWMTAGTSLNLQSRHFVVAVVRVVTVAAIMRFISKWLTTSGTAGLSWFLGSVSTVRSRWAVNSGGTNYISLYDQAAATTSTAIYGGDLQDGVLKSYVDGTVGNTALTGVGTPQNTTSTVTLGVLNQVSADYSNFAFAECIIVNGDNASIDNRQRVEGYLAWKWGGL